MKKWITAFMAGAMLTLTGPAAVYAQDAAISDGSKVQIHYTLTVNEEVVDTSSGREPLEYTQGSQQIIPGLEAALAGLKTGDKKVVVVEPADGYGEEIADAYREVEKSLFPEGFEFKKDLIIEMTSPEGVSLPAVISEVKEDTVMLNFNHPLAGKTLNFDVEIVSVQ